MMEKKYKIKIKLLSSPYHAFVHRLNQVLMFFSLRSRRKYWGVVYDAVTKQPLDPAIVKLSYSNDSETKTCVTDLAGRYGFLAHPGKFKLFAKKTNYSFPSKLVQGDVDGIYENIYHGEFFELTDDYEFIAPNIPMDPVGADWNQNAKLNIFIAHPYREYFIKRIVVIFFWFGFILSLLSLWSRWGGNIQTPSFILWGYGVLFFMAVIVPKTRIWGKLSQSAFLEGELQLELQNKIAPGVVFGKAAALPDGRFFLRAHPGVYELVVKHKNDLGVLTELGSAPVTVHGEGTLNTTVVIR